MLISLLIRETSHLVPKGWLLLSEYFPVVVTSRGSFLWQEMGCYRKDKRVEKSHGRLKRRRLFLVTMPQKSNSTKHVVILLPDLRASGKFLLSSILKICETPYQRQQIKNTSYVNEILLFSLQTLQLCYAASILIFFLSKDALQPGPSIPIIFTVPCFRILSHFCNLCQYYQ